MTTNEDGSNQISGVWSKVMAGAAIGIFIAAFGAVARVEVLSWSFNDLKESNDEIRKKLEQTPTRTDVQLIVENRAQRLFIDLNEKMQTRLDEMEGRIDKRLEAIQNKKSD